MTGDIWWCRHKASHLLPLHYFQLQIIVSLHYNIERICLILISCGSLGFFGHVSPDHHGIHEPVILLVLYLRSFPNAQKLHSNSVPSDLSTHLGETQDLLFITTERYKFCVLQQSADTDEVVTRLIGLQLYDRVFKDDKDACHVKPYELSLKDGDCVEALWSQNVLDNGADLLIPVPPPFCRVLISGEN
ncbi:hypothetical protein L2E82_53342 [Cichorium intybus]|nr:hypothetical protein L2E82_53342 [Cichorium intybus]